MKKMFFIVMITFITLLSGCSTDSNNAKISELEAKIIELEKDNESLNELISDLSDDIEKLEMEYEDLELEIDQTYTKEYIDQLMETLDNIYKRQEEDNALFSDYYRSIRTNIYLGNFENIRFYRGIHITYPPQSCTANIIPSNPIGGGYYIPGGSDGCYNVTVAVKEEVIYYLSGANATTPEDLGLTAEELCSAGKICYYIGE